MSNRYETRKSSKGYAPLKNGLSRKARAAAYARADRHANTRNGASIVRRTVES